MRDSGADHVYMDVELTRYRTKRLPPPPQPIQQQQQQQLSLNKNSYLIDDIMIIFCIRSWVTGRIAS